MVSAIKVWLKPEMDEDGLGYEMACVKNGLYENGIVLGRPMLTFEL